MSLSWREKATVARLLAMHLSQKIGVYVDPVDVRVKLEKEIEDCEKKKTNKESANPT